MLENSVKKFIANSESVGEKITLNELLVLDQKLPLAIPDWYRELLSVYPLAGMEIGWQAFDRTDDFDGIERITILNVALIDEANREGTPGNLLFQLGYFIFGYGSSWAGNAFAMKVSNNEEVAIYEIWHDSARNLEEMKMAVVEMKGVRVVSDSFGDLLENSVA